LDPNEPLSDHSRLDAALHLLREQTTASLPEIAERFGVSEMTVRRDIKKLAASGQVIRVPGTANAAAKRGAKVVFADVDPNTLNLDPGVGDSEINCSHQSDPAGSPLRAMLRYRRRCFGNHPISLTQI
jgi:predicted transcriptional regulator